MRTSGDVKKELFFNHVSYLFFQAPCDIVNNQKGLINIIKTQMYEQVKEGIPRDIMEASHLTRIAPLPFLKKIIDVPLKGKLATFIFSHVGKNPLSPEIMGARIANVFHMPRVPAPPGLGFFSNFFNGRLNLVISYLDGLLTGKEAYAGGNGTTAVKKDKQFLSVLLVVGGVSGVSAAVASARCGMQTVLVESDLPRRRRIFRAATGEFCGLYLQW